MISKRGKSRGRRQGRRGRIKLSLLSRQMLQGQPRQCVPNTNLRQLRQSWLRRWSMLVQPWRKPLTCRCIRSFWKTVLTRLCKLRPLARERFHSSLFCRWIAGRTWECRCWSLKEIARSRLDATFNQVRKEKESGCCSKKWLALWGHSSWMGGACWIFHPSTLLDTDSSL